MFYSEFSGKPLDSDMLSFPFLGRGAWIARGKSVEARLFTVEISTVLQDILYPWTVPWTCQLCEGGTF